MNISDIKIQLAQNILSIDDDELLKKIDALIKYESKKEMDKFMKPMSKEELFIQIDKSNSDIAEGRTKNAMELLKKY